MYRFVLFLHIASVMVFLGAHGISVGTSLWLKRETNPAIARAFLQLSFKTYPFLYSSVLLILATGIAMGFFGHWWGQVWIWVATVVFLATGFAMGAMGDPWRKARSAPPENDEKVLSEMHTSRPHILLAIGLASLVILLTLMVYKPF